MLMPALKNESRITKTVIEAIPLDKGDYRPDPISKTAMGLASHIVQVELMFLKAITAGEFTYGGKLPEEIQNSAELAAWYGQEFDAVFEQLGQLSGEQLVKVVDFRGVFQYPAVMFVPFALHHSVHHRGQLSMYLRPMGAKVPAMYGESHDSAEARKAAAAAQQ